MIILADVEGYGAWKPAVDSVVKYLHLVNKLFSQAELQQLPHKHSVLELVILVYKRIGAYGQRAKCHTMFTNIYDSILKQKSSPYPSTDATYDRVGFYGEIFGKHKK